MIERNISHSVVEHNIFCFKWEFNNFNFIYFIRQEALLAAISEKDANIALLELSASKKKKTQDEVMALKREKDRLVHQLKQQVGRLSFHTFMATESWHYFHLYCFMPMSFWKCSSQVWPVSAVAQGRMCSILVFIAALELLRISCTFTWLTVCAANTICFPSSYSFQLSQFCERGQQMLFA